MVNENNSHTITTKNPKITHKKHSTSVPLSNKRECISKFNVLHIMFPHNNYLHSYTTTECVKLQQSMRGKLNLRMRLHTPLIFM